MMGFKSLRQIVLARHGETDWNARRWVQGSTDTSLNESGVRQAERLSEKLLARGGRIERVFTSEMRRARETAEIGAGRLNFPLIARAGLQELNLGDWEGRTWRQIERGWPERFAEWSRDKRSVRPPHGETYQELLERFVGAVRRIVSETRGDALIVTHSACMLAFQAELNRTPLETMLRDYAAPNAEAIPVSADKILERWGEYPEK